MNVSYLFFRLLLLPFSYLPYSVIHKIGNNLGRFLFPILSKQRKRSLSNLALALDLHLNNQEIESIAKASLGNLFITVLEYGKLARERKIHQVVTCKNPEFAEHLIQNGRAIIFLCGHFANWELLFLEGTSRMKGTAIGAPIKNKPLYAWITRIREKFGGKMITPNQAIKEGLRTLKAGHFFGIVGDQGFPDGGFYAPFLGTNCYTSPLPALLSYRTNSPIMVAITVRQNGKYLIHYSDPIYPDKTKPIDEEIPCLMKQCLRLLENGVKAHPDQWLWQHNRWKKQPPGKLKKKYRQDTILLVFALETDSCLLSTLKKAYPLEEVTLYLPTGYEEVESFGFEVRYYVHTDEIKLKEYRYKLLINFSQDLSINKFFKKLSVLECIDHTHLQHSTLEDLLYAR